MSTRVRVGDVHLAVREWGSGPPLVLLHGFTGSAALWTALGASFGRRYRTIAVDLLGHGDADAPADPARYGMDRAVADLVVLLDVLAVARTALLGYSMGGRVALALALAHPERVSALVLESASPGIADAAERRARLAHDAALADRIESDGVAAFVDEWMRQPLFASQHRLAPAARAAARAQRLANRSRGLVGTLRGLGSGAQDPLWHRLHALRVPTLLLAGADDAKFTGLAGAMARQLPSATRRIVPDAGHATHLENPAAFVRLVGEFLDGGAACPIDHLRTAQEDA